MGSFLLIVPFRSSVYCVNSQCYSLSTVLQTALNYVHFEGMLLTACAMQRSLLDRFFICVS